ncbi:MAG: GNAT family N-acetyltransferase [Nanoarchaeales archaeon]|nr:GNAT family N-acetyltransferase [Nanoarchaeales archaeon]
MEEIKIEQIQNKYKNEFISSFSDGSYFDNEKEAEGHFKLYLKSKRLYLLFENENLIGFFNYFYQYSHFANYLEDISVNKNYQKKGYSKYLLSKYIEISKEQKTKNVIALSSTHLTNKTSQQMHKSFGFEEIGTLKKLHYGIDEIFYAYNLK